MNNARTLSQEIITKMVTDLGYTNIKWSAAKGVKLFVYVPDCDRVATLDHIAKELSEHFVKSDDLKARRISNKGILKHHTDKWMIIAKPDKSNSLSTDEQEVLQAFHIAQAVHFNELSNGGASFNYRQLVETDLELNPILEKATDGWKTSAQKTAEFVFKNYIDGAPTSFVVCHRSKADGFVNRLYTKALGLMRKHCGGRMMPDKWNPSDVWLVNPNFLNTNWDHFKTIEELNDFLKTCYSNGSIVGVSLKLISGKTAKGSVYNLEKNKVYSYVSHNAGRTNFIRTYEGLVEYDSGWISIRCPGRIANVVAEIQGKSASHGKIGAGALFNIVRKFDPEISIPNHQEISQLYKDDKSDLFLTLYEFGKILDPVGMEHTDFDDFCNIVEAKPNTESYCVSKYQSAIILDVLNRMTPQDRNVFVQMVMDYASSQTEISSVFVKVY